MRQLFIAMAACAGLAACAGQPGKPPLETVDHVDLERFMGRWYVIANIPTFIEKEAYNAVESYSLNPDGTVSTEFTFRSGGFDGEPKRYTPTGFVQEAESNAVWKMQFVWPFKADYRIIYLNADYSQTVIGRNKRDHVWVMARTPQIPSADMERIERLLAGQGYDASALQRVPQRWD